MGRGTPRLPRPARLSDRKGDEMGDQFLTVMAVLDDDAQRIMTNWQSRILAAGLRGTQTMGIPFHISLGSYPPSREAELIALIRKTAAAHGAFPVDLTALGDFNDRVLFARPDDSAPLAALRAVFNHDYPHRFPWSPHATLFCGQEDEVRQARSILSPLFAPFRARVTALEMGRFFPAHFVCRQALTGNEGPHPEASFN